MKIIDIVLILMVSIMCVNTNKAQDYLPTLTESRFYELVENRGMGYLVNHSYLIGCDSFINGVNYKKAQTLTSNSPLGLYREDTISHKIYRWNEQMEKEMLIIDYDLELGDTMSIRDRSLVVSRIDSIDVFSKIRKAIYFNGAEYFIEGIGYRFGGVHDFGGYIDITAVNNVDYDCTTRKFDLEEITAFPNPTTGIINVSQLKNDVIHVVIFNLIGEKVKDTMYRKEIDLSDLETGIYLMQIKGLEKKFKIVKM